ncbi:DUF6266 family protein [Pedobacter faecalis]|uniref:DUF6266 family protein n=1 Tax=Pedobacter faecalis TaxID=3041495 RepID=UPI00254E30A4|nr:DUF6266 family protein [Pedobacter sp. ELA7]
MAVFRNNLLGAIRGRVGNMVSYVVLGKNVVRMIGQNNKPPTEKQLANRQAMKVICEVLSMAKPFTRIGFDAEAKLRSLYPQNVGISVNKPAALKGVYPQIEVDYPKLKLSMGSVPGLMGLTVVAEDDGLCITWTPVLDWQYMHDRIMVVVYFPELAAEKHEKACIELSGARRSEGMERIPLSPALLNQRMEVFVAMRAACGADVSDSQYAGRLN